MPSRKTPSRQCVVVMGVAGTGKSTIAQLLANRLGWRLAEADEFHSQANIDKMTAGIPLTDVDRLPWLAEIRDWISERSRAGDCTVVACSALKRSYRDVLRKSDAQVRFVFLHGTPDVVGQRLTDRSGHFMPPSLLASQFGDLQPLQPDEDGVVADVRETPAQIVDSALTRLALEPGTPPTR